MHNIEIAFERREQTLHRKYSWLVPRLNKNSLLGLEESSDEEDPEEGILQTVPNKKVKEHHVRMFQSKATLLRLLNKNLYLMSFLR